MKVSKELEDKAFEYFREEYAKGQEGMLEMMKSGTISYSGTIQELLEQFKDHDMLEAFEGGKFYAPIIARLFESSVYLEYFSDLLNKSVRIADYVEADSLDEKSMIASFMKDVESIRYLKVMGEIVKDSLETMGVEIEGLDIYNKDKMEEFLKPFKYGKQKAVVAMKDVDEYGFCVSKIPVRGGGFIKSDKLQFNDNIFYVFKPENIIPLARTAEPGVYLLAQVPEDIGSMMFYVLFVTPGDAYVIDNGYHDFRTTMRSRCEGRQLDRKTSGNYFPWDTVYNFFIDKKKSKNRELVHKGKELGFTQIGKISAEGPESVLYMYALIDTCLWEFLETDVLKNSGVAVNMDILKLQPSSDKEKGTALTVYRNDLPAIKDLDIDWDNDKFGFDEITSGTYLEPVVKKKDLDLSKVKYNVLEPLHQLERRLAYRKRELEANAVANKLHADFKRNSEKVLEKVKGLVVRKMIGDKFLVKAFKNKKYKYDYYKGFGDTASFDRPAKFEGKSKVESREILSTTDPAFPRWRTSMYTWNNDHSFNLCGIERGHYTCFACYKKANDLSYELEFLDVQQFIDFFELGEEEVKRLPKQLLVHLNQARTLYDGNSILNDVDPLGTVHNPWWGERGDPSLSIYYHLCVGCRKDFLKKAGVKFVPVSVLREKKREENRNYRRRW